LKIGKPVARKWRNLRHLLTLVGPCGKVMHSTEAEAQAEEARMATTFKANQTFWTYRCNQCGAWHVTSNRYSPPRNVAAAKGRE
jgi:hypothetical protein